MAFHHSVHSRASDLSATRASQPERMDATILPTRQGLFARDLIKPALVSAVIKFKLTVQARNPVMFVVYLCSLLTIGQWLAAMAGHAAAPAG